MKKLYKQALELEYILETKRAFDLFKQLSEMGHKKSMHKLYEYYIYGIAGVTDEKLSKMWLEKSGKKEMADVTYIHARYLYIGFDMEKDVERAFELFKRAIQQGETLAYAELGDCYRLGHGCAQDFDKAFDCYKKALRDKYNPQKVYNNYAMCYYHGCGTEKNQEEALKWLEKSASYGYSAGAYNLASCYLYGVGVEKNDELAQKLYRQALNDCKKKRVRPDGFEVIAEI